MALATTIRCGVLIIALWADVRARRRPGGQKGRQSAHRLRSVRSLREVALGVVGLAGVAFVFAAFQYNAWWGQSRSDHIVDAVDAYRAEKGEYPDRLDLLVPKHLTHVPRACWRLVLCEFDYFLNTEKDDPMLVWVRLPPFGRPTYRFKDQERGYLD